MNPVTQSQRERMGLEAGKICAIRHPLRQPGAPASELVASELQGNKQPLPAARCNQENTGKVCVFLLAFVTIRAPILTGGEGVAHRVGRAYNDPIQPRGILSQWHRLPTPRDCAGRPISEAQKKKGGAGLARAERHQSAGSPRTGAFSPTNPEPFAARCLRGRCVGRRGGSKTAGGITNRHAS